MLKYEMKSPVFHFTFFGMLTSRHYGLDSAPPVAVPCEFHVLLPERALG